MLPDFYNISEENFNKSLKYYNITNNTIKFSHQSLSKFKQYTNEYCSKLDNLIKEGKNVIGDYIIIDSDNINNDKDNKNEKNDFDVKFINPMEKSTERINNFYEIFSKYLNNFIKNLDKKIAELEQYIIITKNETANIDKDYEKQKDIFKSKCEEVENINSQLKENYSNCEKQLIEFCYDRRIDGIDYEANYKLFFNNVVLEENNLIEKFNSLGNFGKVFLDCTKQKLKQIQEYSYSLFINYDNLSKDIHNIFNNSLILPLNKLIEEKHELIEGENLDDEFKKNISSLLTNQTNSIDENKTKFELKKYNIKVLSSRNIKVHPTKEDKKEISLMSNKKEKSNDKITNNNLNKTIMITLTDKEIFFVVQNLYTEYKLINKSEYDLDLEEKKLELRDIFLRIFNTPSENNKQEIEDKDDDFFLIEKYKEITKEEFDTLCEKLSKEDYRKALLIVINNYRAKGKMVMSDKAFNYFIRIFSIICNHLAYSKETTKGNNKFVKDPICARLVIILSQTFYTVKNKEKVYLCEEIKKEKIFNIPEFWQDLIRDMIITESKSVMENRKKINMEVNENKLRQIKENIYFSQIIPFVGNMKDFGIGIEEIKSTIELIKNEFNIPEDTMKRIEEYIVGQFEV